MPPEIAEMHRRYPLAFAKFYWPDVEFYGKQRDIIHSVRDNDETYVAAGNQLGKDFVAAFICLWYFLTHHPVKVVTTSVADKHLMVLWGEIDKFIRNSAYPLRVEDGGPLQVMHNHIRKVVGGQVEKDVYMVGQVAQKGEKFGGHHADHTLLVIDEASGYEDDLYSQSQGWAKKGLIFGNPWPTANFYKRNFEAGDLLANEEADEPVLISGKDAV